MAHVTENMRAAARENGKLGGRPKGSGVLARFERARRVARRIGEQGAIEAVEFLRAVMHGRAAGLGAEHRLAAARDLMDRFGFPRLAQQQHFGEFPTKLYELNLAPKPASNGHADPAPAPAGNGRHAGSEPTPPPLH